MDVCFITPTPLLKTIAVKSRTHLVLAHQYLADVEYAEFYNFRRLMGDYVMLDNSAYELGESMAVETLEKIATSLKPNAIFLPDKRFDASRTLELVEKGIEKLKHLGIPLYAVPQGSNLQEIFHCYDQLCKLPIDGFGLYEEIGQVSRTGRRWDFCALLQATKRVHSSKYYHMLGMEEDVHSIKYLAEFDWVRSIDSVKPIAYGLYGVQMHSVLGPMVPYRHRPRGYFELHSGEFHNIIEHNCNLTIKWAQNSPRK